MFNKTTVNVVNFYHAALAAISALKHVMGLASAQFPVAMDVNALNYVKFYPVAMGVNVNTFSGAFLAVMMPFVIFLAASKDANFVIASIPVEMDFSVWEIVSAEIAIVKDVTVMAVTWGIAILEDVILVTVIAETTFRLMIYML